MPVTSSTVIEINQTGIASDNNGGGFDPTLGTVDYTYGPNAQAISVSNIQINGSNNTQIYSSSRPFVANDVGNTIYIRGGTGFTVDRYVITSVSSGWATLNAACGTAGSTGGYGTLGGPLASPGALHPIVTAEDYVAAFIAEGTYTISTLNTGSGGVINNTTKANSSLTAYKGTRGTPGMAVLDARNATGSTVYVIGGMNCTGIEIWCSQATAINGFYQCACCNCVVKYAGSARYGFNQCYCLDCLADSCEIGFGNTGSIAYNCVAMNCSYGGFRLYFMFAAHCIALNCGYGFYHLYARGAASNCVAYGITNDGFSGRSLSPTPTVVIKNCVAVNCGGYGFTGNNFLLMHCAGYNNVSGNYNPTIETYGRVVNFKSLTTNPFQNVQNWNISDISTTDFRLNAIGPQGGFDLRGTGLGSQFIPYNEPDIGSLIYPRRQARPQFHLFGT